MKGRRAASACLPFLLAAVLAVSSVSGQQNGQSEPRPRRVLVFFSARGAGIEAGQELVLRESLLVALAGARADLVMLEAADTAGPDDAARSASAGARRCEAWIDVSVSLEGEALKIALRVYDLFSKRVAAERSSSVGVPEPRDLARDFWDETRDALAKALPPLPKSAAGLVVTGVPGSRVSGLGDAELVLDESGRAVLDLPIPAAFNLGAEAEGYYRLREGWLADREGFTVNLRQEALPRFASNVGLLGGYMTAGFAWFPLPARFFLRAEIVNFLIGFQLASSQSSDVKAPPFFFSRKLVTIGLMSGYYFSPPDDDFRLYAGGGGSIRIMLGSVGGLEPIVPCQLQALVGWEYSGVRRIKFYFEWTPLLYLPTDASWFRASKPRGASYLPLAGGYLDPSVVAFGARFYL